MACTEESIYNLVPIDYVPPPKKKMYRSKFDANAPVVSSSFGCHGTTLLVGAGRMMMSDAKTFGYPKEKVQANPKKFLKSGEKQSKVPARTTQKSQFKRVGTKKPSIPKRSERPVYGLKTVKNFITANAVETILQIPKVPETIEPDYLKKADYGKPPAYLSQVKEEIKRENQLIDAYVKEQMGLASQTGPSIEELPELERLELIHALKTKWDAVNAKYQKITHITKYSRGSVHKKEAMEAELEQIEKDIVRLERKGPVLISSCP